MSDLQGSIKRVRKMIKAGICSITFRRKNPDEIVRLAEQAGLDAIEWGGDVHVPAGDTAVARRVGQITLDAGLSVSSYGSYYRVLDADGTPQEFLPVLDSAVALGADTIRIWPGRRPSESAGEDYRRKFSEHLRMALDASRQAEIRLALEFHENTLSDSPEAALRLLDEVNHPNLSTYWQPMYWVSDPEINSAGLEKLSGRVSNLHVFHWTRRGNGAAETVRHALEEGSEEWLRYLRVPLCPGIERSALLEFVRDDDTQQFFRDAATLRSWLASEPSGGDEKGRFFTEALQPA